MSTLLIATQHHVGSDVGLKEFYINSESQTKVNVQEYEYKSRAVTLEVLPP